ncbi:MAG: hypothetical protein K940chlam7_00993 [Chlamydiae bacterium]|nr:hypothetical protein [Chlamydiota bacterium]
MVGPIKKPGDIPPLGETGAVERKSAGKMEQGISDEDTMDRLFALVQSVQAFNPEEKEAKYKYLISDKNRKIRLIKENLSEFIKTPEKEDLVKRINAITDLGYMRIRKLVGDKEKREELYSMFFEPSLKKPPPSNTSTRERPKLERGRCERKIAYTPAILPPSVSGDRTPVQTEMLKQAKQRAEFHKDTYRIQALSKLGSKVIKSEKYDDQLAALNALKMFIRNSSPTRNFDGSNMGKLKRLEESLGWERPWDLPRDTQEESYIRKRDLVERKIHGYSDIPYAEEGFAANRPVYMGINPGNGPRGAAPGYGGSYFVAKRDVYRKSTLTAGDTFSEKFIEGRVPAATIDTLEIVIANMEVEDLKELYLMATDQKPPKPLKDNRYIEVQIANLKWSDYEKIVLDRKEVPVGSEAERRWEAMAAKHGFRLEFFDSKGWEQAILKGNLAQANREQGPLTKSEESRSSRKQPSNPTKLNVDYFMIALGLAIDKSKDGNISQNELREMCKAYGEIVNPATSVGKPEMTSESTEDDSEKKPILMLFYQLLEAAKPYGEKYNKSIVNFISENSVKFRSYVDSLPEEEDITKAEQARAIKKGKKPSKKEEKKLEEKVETIRAQAMLKKRIKSCASNFSDFGHVPVTFTGKWSILVGDFKKALDKRDHAGMLKHAKAMYKEQELFCERMNLENAVENDL